jgi:23S rRNA (pseudouridine1915-N3)-methyltransferase
MKITLMSIGKTDTGYLQAGIKLYTERLKHYIPFEAKELPALKKTTGMTPEHIRQKEAELFLKHLEKPDCIVLLDEKGKEFTSRKFSEFLQARMNAGTRDLVFVIGGAWGFSDTLKSKANFSISLSKMTFSHQMVRLFFAEQLYRAFTILKGESYHND